MSTFVTSVIYDDLPYWVEKKWTGKISLGNCLASFKEMKDTDIIDIAKDIEAFTTRDVFIVVLHTDGTCSHHRVSACYLS